MVVTGAIIAIAPLADLTFSKNPRLIQKSSTARRGIRWATRGLGFRTRHKSVSFGWARAIFWDIPLGAEIWEEVCKTLVLCIQELTHCQKESLLLQDGTLRARGCVCVCVCERVGVCVRVCRLRSCTLPPTMQCWTSITSWLVRAVAVRKKSNGLTKREWLWEVVLVKDVTPPFIQKRRVLESVFCMGLNPTVACNKRHCISIIWDINSRLFLSCKALHKTIWDELSKSFVCCDMQGFLMLWYLKNPKACNLAAKTAFLWDPLWYVFGFLCRFCGAFWGWPLTAIRL